MVEEYTSSDMNDMASTAPSHTIPEVIESLAQKDIATLQLGHRERMDVLTGDEFAQRFYEKYQAHANVQELYEAQLNRTQIELRTATDTHVEAVQHLAKYRLDHYLEQVVE